jgi:hypothetical protein
VFNIKDIQGTARDTIAAATLDSVAYFEDADVIADVGLSADAIMQRLEARGFVVVVDIPLGVRTSQRAPSVTHGEVPFGVIVQVNPKINAEQLNRNVLEIVDVVCSAMLAYGSDPTDRFEHDEEAVTLYVDDQGLLSYLILFHAQTVLAPYVTI